MRNASIEQTGRNDNFLTRHWNKLLAAVLWLAMIAALIWYMRVRGIGLSELFFDGVAWAQSSPLAPLVYILIYAVRPLTFFSSVLLTLAGGFVFGPVWGIVYTAIGANLSATVAFWIGHYFGGGVLDDEASQGFAQRYARRMRANSFETVLIMRLIFLPYDLVNYFAGFLRINYWAFLLATIIGSIPGTIAFVFLGASLAPVQLAELFLSGEVPRLDWRILALSGLMFVVSLVLSRIFKRSEQRSRPAS